MGDRDPSRSRGSDEPDDVLRAKYHDYCSAQLADLLLYLTPDEIYTLAQRAARDQPDAGGDLSYARMVDVATEWLSRKVVLPPFEIWMEDYRAHPELYEEYFMGLWESEVPKPTEH